MIRAPLVLNSYVGIGFKSPESSPEQVPHTPQEHADSPRAHLLCDVIVTGIDAVAEQVLGAAITAAEVTVVHELPVGWRAPACHVCHSLGPNSGYGLGEFSVQGLPEERSQEDYST